MSHWTLFDPPSEEEAIRKRDIAIAQVTTNAGHEFSAKAREFIVKYLREHGPTPGETLTAEAMKSGIVPANGPRAFGGSFLSLSKRNIIMKYGSCSRKRGHSCQGGVIWALS